MVFCKKEDAMNKNGTIKKGYKQVQAANGISRYIHLTPTVGAVKTRKILEAHSHIDDSDNNNDDKKKVPLKAAKITKIEKTPMKAIKVKTVKKAVKLNAT